MLNSKLPVDVLGRIWDLSDQDQDGSLDIDEFVVSMHLVSKALRENAPIPMSLPPQLVKTKPLPTTTTTVVDPLSPLAQQANNAAAISNPIPSCYTAPAAPSPVPTSATNNGATPTPPQVAPSANSPPTVSMPPVKAGSPTLPNGETMMDLEREKHLKLFRRLDTDNDGLVNGADCKQTLLDTGLPQQDLAFIWGSVDTGQTGRLNSGQFIQAMILVDEKLRERNKPTGNKELDALNEEIRQLQT